jgi:cell division protein FtsB
VTTDPGLASRVLRLEQQVEQLRKELSNLRNANKNRKRDHIPARANAGGET